MKNINKICIAAMVVMAAVSFINLLGIVAAGISVFIGIIFFFLNKAREKQPFAGSGLNIRAIGADLSKAPIWFWIAMPLVMDLVCILLSKLLLPEYIDHVLARTEIFVSLDKTFLLIVELAVLALGEEIAWRAFFQKQLQKALPPAAAVIVTSLLFAAGHITSGSFVVVAYDVFFVFINSIFYGIVFNKTNNAWISTISHFGANLFSVAILMFL